jgi:hypothetical protein
MSDEKPKTSAPVNIRVKRAPGDASDPHDEPTRPDDGVTVETRGKTTGRGKADMGSLPDE